MMDEDTVRCRKCRKVLLADLEGLQNAHGQKHQGGKAGTESTECTLLSEKSCLYISEDSYPQFVTDALDMSSWTKGKLNCPGCQARIGSFNYISGSHCTCGNNIVPQVHLLVSKVDVRQAREALPSPISYPDCPVALTDADIKTFPLIGASKQVSISECDSNASTPSPVLHQLCDEETPSTASDPDDMQLRESIESIPFPSSAAHQNESTRKKIRRLARHREVQKQTTSTESDLQLLQSSSKSSNFCALAPSDKETSDDDERTKWFEDIPPHLTCSIWQLKSVKNFLTCIKKDTNLNKHITYNIFLYPGLEISGGFSLVDHSYAASFTKLVDNILVYMAGWVVRKVMTKLSCDVCRACIVSEALPSTNDESYHLLQIKNRGDFVIPSAGTVKVVRVAEKCIRQGPSVTSAAHSVTLLQVFRAV
ncbi:uncharacterized protein LOC135217651 [Macrobrachium nipponense]|uniref:uncharacterized protein LOC135217651 n=1 Tax=Macrobrachium nipponense TaxID=159736 RepID=UPI0030C7FDC1